ncbi:MAG: family 43 glycosylhydrolase [Prolixibacteraceae bacterium]|jgi:xylan 1,4-beta-xylosidase|nr:family 43 glycosylhydrolase [Prolixibacteraceae bacterium]
MHLENSAFALLLIFFIAACNPNNQTSNTDANNPTSADFFENPVLGGDYPDPSVVRVGNDFYMTHSSFDYYPGLLIWHSTDLVNWQRVTHALHQYVGSVWSPDLIYHEGIFYIYFPAGGTNWVVTANSPEGTWSEPINLNLPGFIDPGHAVDEEGNRYLFLSKGYAIELSDDGLSTVGEARKVYDGWEFPKEWSTECFCLESPKITVRDGYFYLTSAEGGTAGPATSHMVVSARSKNPFGPYENSPYNPIVHTENRNERWWSQGHGTLVDDIEGKWWILYHGYEKHFHTLGRQTLMLPIEWANDGWFKVPDGIDSEDKIENPAGKPMQKATGLSDDFSTERLALQWQFLKEYKPERVNLANGKLMFEACGEKFADCSPLLVNAADRKYEVTVEYEINAGVKAGLCLYYNEQAHMRIQVDENEFTVFIQDKAKIRKSSLSGNKGHLRILNDLNEVSFYFSKDGKNWEKVERSLDATGYNHNVFAEFLSLRAGVFAFGKGQATFDNFKYNILN